MNASNQTTLAEISQVHGVREEVKRAAGLNLTAGEINATEIMCSVLGAPTFNMLSKRFEEKIGHRLN